jgi:small membrane protein
MLIKILLVAALLGIAGFLVWAPRGAPHLAARRLLLLAFAAGAALSVIYPGTWNRAAKFVGVGRGTDLLLYCLIVAFLGFVVTTYIRFREVEERMTMLARRLALDEAEHHHVSGAKPLPPMQPAPEELRDTTEEQGRSAS